MFVSVRRVQCRTRHLCIAFILDVCVCESCWVTNIFVQLARKLKLNIPSSQPDYFTIQKLYVEYDKYVKRECVFIVYTYHKPYYKFKLCNNAGCVCVCQSYSSSVLLSLLYINVLQHPHVCAYYRYLYFVALKDPYREC